jgi:hypothetical protein
MEGEEGRAGRAIWGLEMVRSLAEERKGELDFLVLVAAALVERGAIVGFSLYWSVS